MNEEKETLAQRNEAKRLEIQAARIKMGYFRAHLLPMITWGIIACIVLFAFRRFVIDGTVFDSKASPRKYKNAEDFFYSGNLQMAEEKIAEVLQVVPNHSASNQLMAEIELTKGNRKLAIGYLRIAADTALNRGTILKWIEDLEKADATPPKTK